MGHKKSKFSAVDEEKSNESWEKWREEREGKGRNEVPMSKLLPFISFQSISKACPTFLLKFTKAIKISYH